MNKVPCITCGLYKVNKSTAKVKPYCRECWAKEFNTLVAGSDEATVKCGGCNSVDIPARTAKFKPYCLSCYKQKKAENRDFFIQQHLETLDIQEGTPHKKSVRPIYKAFANKELIEKKNENSEPESTGVPE